MPTNFQYRLQQYESDPPAGSWKNINARLDVEFDIEEIKISEKLADYGVIAPPAAWDRISTELDGTHVKPAIEIQPELRRPPIPMKFLRVAAAAIICITITTLYFLISGNNTAEKVSFVNVPVQDNKSPDPSPITADTNVRLAQTVPQGPSQNRRIRQYIRNRAGNSLPVVQASFLPVEASEDNTNEDIDYTIVNGTEKFNLADDINIPTHPIRDRDGNIIMDEKLVSAPDGNYVTVTGPNGEQTKISKKFLNALSYMNEDSKEEDYMGILLHDGSLWKWLFQEWRKKLLNQPSFIPTATNFLDIMELKEILHENF